MNSMFWKIHSQNLLPFPGSLAKAEVLCKSLCWAMLGSVLSWLRPHRHNMLRKSLMLIRPLFNERKKTGMYVALRQNHT